MISPNRNRATALLISALAVSVVPQASSAKAEDTAYNNLVVRFLIEGGQSPKKTDDLGPPDRLSQVGEVLTATEVIASLTEETVDRGGQGKVEDASLLISVEEAGGDVLVREVLSKCAHLDLYAEPSSPWVMKATCDDQLFEYLPTAQGLAFTRSGKEIRSLELLEGFYSINGALHRVLPR